MAVQKDSKTDGKPAGDEPTKADGPVFGDAGDATVPPSVTPTVADTRGGVKFDSKPGGKVDPRTGEPFKPAEGGLKGVSGTDVDGDTPRLPAPALVTGGDARTGQVPPVDPDRIPAEKTPGVTPEASGDGLLAAAQAKAPSLTREFVDRFGLTDGDLAAIARGEVPPPPTPGPIHSADLYLTSGGWQQVPPGVPLEDAGKNAISR